jgi:hypothetical protein
LVDLSSFAAWNSAMPSHTLNERLPESPSLRETGSPRNRVACRVAEWPNGWLRKVPAIDSSALEFAVASTNEAMVPQQPKS